VIEIDSLTKKYGAFTAVDNVSLTVADGEIFGFLGPNGAGKTTTIRILAGLSLPTSGRVSINGLDVVNNPIRSKAIVGYIPDRPFLYEKLTGIELVRFVSDLYKQRWRESRVRAESLLEYFDLTRWAGSRIENYSHGMKQKLVIVAALAHDPQVLVIDEPMVGLDALAQKQVRQLLATEASRGKTIFLTTHTLSVAEAVCDRVSILHRGRIAASGTPDELKAVASMPGSALEDVFLEVTTGGEQAPAESS
jgi:ABC-2 type transport system ATP-binding protein